MAKRDSLNVKMIERLKEPGKYTDGRNLYLHVGPNGSKSWLFIYRRLGADRMRGLFKQLWRTLHPTAPRPRWPVHPHQIAAERHGVNRQVLDEAIKRPSNRRGDRIAARK